MHKKRNPKKAARRYLRSADQCPCQALPTSPKSDPTQSEPWIGSQGSFGRSQLGHRDLPAPQWASRRSLTPWEVVRFAFLGINCWRNVTFDNFSSHGFSVFALYEYHQRRKNTIGLVFLSYCFQGVVLGFLSIGILFFLIQSDFYWWPNLKSVDWRANFKKKNIARCTADPCYWVCSLSYLSR